MYHSKKQLQRWIILFLFGIFILSLAFFVYTLNWQDKNLEVSFLNVGQGDSIYIKSPSGVDILIDGGRDASVLYELGKVMPFNDKKINMVLATHPDEDHIAGLGEVIKRYNVNWLFKPCVLSKTDAGILLEEYSKRVNSICVKRGLIIDLGAGVFLKVLSPAYQTKNMDTNVASIVVQLVYGNTKIMLTGDAPVSIERELALLDKELLQSDILKAGHHGSKTSTSPEFLGFVDPKIVIISAGKNNRYGHPHKSVVKRLNDYGAQILETSKEGTITFYSDGNSIWREIK